MNIHKHKSQSNNKTNNNNQLTPELNHHLIPSRNSRSLAQALPTKNKRWNSSSQKPAFTIIEVVLVLAIAGLIFLMVFIALPALQRNQRDTRRKNDLATFASALQNYAANNRGRYPSTSGATGGLVTSSNAPEVFQFATQYLDWPGHRQAREDKGFVDPSTSEGYAVFFAWPIYNNVAAASPDRMNYSTDYRCPEPASTSKYTANAISIWQKLEGGGINCIDVR